MRKARGIAKLKIDAFKLPHHGSSGNINSELFTALPSDRYVFSTSGAAFGHPDGEAVAHVISAAIGSRKTLHFNHTAVTIAKDYKKIKKRNQPKWSKAQLKREYDYNVEFPLNDGDGIAIEW